MMPRRATGPIEGAGHGVVMAVDESMVKKDDITEHIVFANQQGAILVTYDRAFAGRAMKQTDHPGVICWLGELDDIGGIIRELLRFAGEHSPTEVAGRVFWIK
jgi:hypothetical protein